VSATSAKGEMVFSEAGKMVFSLLPNTGVSNHWTGICFILSTLSDLRRRYGCKPIQGWADYK